MVAGEAYDKEKRSATPKNRRGQARSWVFLPTCNQPHRWQRGKGCEAEGEAGRNRKRLEKKGRQLSLPNISQEGLAPLTNAG